MDYEVPSFFTQLLSQTVIAPFSSLENGGWEQVEFEPLSWQHSCISSMASVMQGESL